MVPVVLLGLSCLLLPLGATDLDSNKIKSLIKVHSRQKGPQCTSDEDCSSGKFCIRPDNEKPYCAACRGQQRQCQQTEMCCPGLLCLHDVCTAVEDEIVMERQAHHRDGTDTKETTTQPAEEPDVTTLQGSRGDKGKPCRTDLDCDPGFCCARHFWSKICKPILLEGQVCSSREHKDTAHTPEIFQRCDCHHGLVCRSNGTDSQQQIRLRVCQKTEKAVSTSP